MKLVFSRKLATTILLILVASIVVTRLFAYSVLGAPFIGETLHAAFVDREKPKKIVSQDFTVLSAIAHPIDKKNLTAPENYAFFKRDVFNDVNIFGLGEATHGTKEFFEIKSHIFQYLVYHADVKLFAIEANFAACDAINKYVLTGEGNAGEALAQNGYWVWQTQEILDLIRWMRAYNVDKTETQKIQFYGYDMQNATSAIAWLEKYLSRQSANFNSNLLPDKFDENTDSLRRLSKKDIEKLQKNNLTKLSALSSFLKSQEAELLQKNTADFRFANQTIEVIRQKLLYFIEEDFNTAYSFRDSSMAQNIKWIVENNNDQKIALWAHNGHIGKGSFSTDYSTGNWMGTHLNKLFGKAYYNIGFCFNEGAFVAQSPASTNTLYLMISFIKSLFKDEPWLVSINKVKPHAKSHLTRMFSELQKPCFFLNFKDASQQESLTAFLNKPYEHYEAGAVYINEKSAIWKTNLYELFDGIIYVDKTEAAENFLIGQFAK